MGSLDAQRIKKAGSAFYIERYFRQVTDATVEYETLSNLIGLGAWRAGIFLRRTQLSALTFSIRFSGGVIALKAQAKLT